ncbi:MAG TPA: YciI family protein [Myxococcales bacterium]|nr:YciI family protein [Myxococcales bacterium]
MSYMLLIVEPPGQRRERSEEEGRAVYDRMLRFASRLKERGLLTMTQSLRSDADGARVQVRGGKRKVVDGPFTEAKEMVGGFFLLDCDSREQAIAIAAECPAAEWATVEVRELGPCYT